MARMTTRESEFRELIRREGELLYRDMPWRRDTRPYYVLVSELMLQQTQVSRVIDKFQQFITRFPDIPRLADAPLSEVIMLWQGLGYNRRAKYLHDTARLIMNRHAGKFPRERAELEALPGIGPNTAGALLAYAFNVPTLFIETNIRTVYIHHFFADSENVKDSQIIKRLEATLDATNPRKWYWSLMDYGAELKRQGVRAHRASVHHRTQTPLKGSVREVRGRILTYLSSQGESSMVDVQRDIDADQRFEVAIGGLIRDEMVCVVNGRIDLTK